MKPAILRSAASVIATMTPKRIFLVVALAWAGLLPAAAFVPPDRDPQWQTSLNGEWTFKLNGPAAEFVQPEFDDSAWAKIRVPQSGDAGVRGAAIGSGPLMAFSNLHPAAVPG